MSYPNEWTPEDVRSFLVVLGDVMNRSGPVPGVNDLPVGPVLPGGAVPGGAVPGGAVLPGGAVPGRREASFRLAAPPSNIINALGMDGPAVPAGHPANYRGRLPRSRNRTTGDLLGFTVPPPPPEVQPGSSSPSPDVRMGSQSPGESPERDDPWQYWDGGITSFRFTCNHGSTIETSWGSDEQMQYLEKFRNKAYELNITYVSIFTSFLENNVPLRTMRFTRLAIDGHDQRVYQEDQYLGTWTFNEEPWGSAFLVVNRGEGRLKWFEHVPGTGGWCRRPDTMGELEWSVFLFPMWHTVPALRPLGASVTPGSAPGTAPGSAESTLERPASPSPTPGTSSMEAPGSVPASPSAPVPNQPSLPDP